MHLNYLKRFSGLRKPTDTLPYGVIIRLVRWTDYTSLKLVIFPYLGPSMEATLLQLKDPNIAQQSPFTPSNSLFASNATISGESSNRLEQLLLSASVAAACNIPSNGLHSQLRVRQTGSTPNLLPPAWQAAAPQPPSAVDLLRSGITGATGIGGPLPSPGLEFSGLYRKGS